jgi:M6 family metalloprotease-like protein
MLRGLTLFAFCCVSLFAQGREDAAARLRAMNGQLLSLHGESMRLENARKGSVRGRVRELLAARRELLRSLILSDAGEALRLAFSGEALTALSSEFRPDANLLEEQGEWEGEAEVLIADDFEGNRERQILRLATPQGTFNIQMAGPMPDVQCADRLRVKGIKVGDDVAASGGTVTTSSSTPPPCTPTGAQKAVVLLVTFPGVVPPSTVTAQSVNDIFFGASGRSVDGYWRETSYGRTSVSGDVFGWYTLDYAWTCDQYQELRASAIRAADPYVDFRKYNRLFLVFPKPVTGCAWSGLGSLSCTTLASADGNGWASTSWLLASSMDTRDRGVRLATHEGGHNLGLSHAGSRRFTGEPLGNVGVAGSVSEYGDRFNTMGSSNLGHYSAPHKQRLGWLASPTNVLTVESSGSYTLQPIEVSPPGVQALKIRRGTGNEAWLWVEYRQPIGGYDNSLSSQIFTGALIHYQDATTPSNRTHLLDYTAATTSWLDPALAAGNTWIDPYSNVSIQIQSATSSALNLRVDFGPLPCFPAAPTVSVSPANPSTTAGGSVSYTVSVTNKDSAGCASSPFSLTVPAPAWPAAFALSSLTIAPGKTASTTLTLTAPAGTVPGTYAVSVRATTGSRYGAAAANITVLAPPPPLSISLAVPPGPYAARSNVTMTATVLSGTSPANGASVQFRLNKPSGFITNTVTANSSGVASWTYRLANGDPVGSYSVSATATFGSQSVTSPLSPFTVY